MAKTREALLDLSEHEKIERILALEAQLEIAQSSQTNPQKALLEETNFFQTVLNNIDDHIFVRDLDGQYLFVNESQAHSLKTTPDAMIGTALQDWFVPELVKEFTARDREILETGEPVHNTEAYTNKHGEDTWKSVTKYPLKDDNGSIIGVIGIARDITDAHQAREQLEQQYQQLRTLIDTLPDHVFIYDTNDCFLQVNQAMVDAASADSIDAMVGTHYTHWYSGRRADEIKAENDQIRAEKQPILNLTHESSLFEDTWYSVSKAPVLDDAGNVTAIVGIVRDVSDVKRAEAQREQQYQQLRTLIDTLPDHVFIFDNQNRYLQVNRSLAADSGAGSVDAMIGTTPDQWYSADKTQLIYEENSTVISRKQPILNYVGHTKEDHEIWYSMSKVPIQDTAGNVTAIVGIARDITALKHAEQQREQQYQQLRTLIDTLPDHVFFFDKDGYFMQVNQSLASASHVDSPETLVGTHYSQWYTADRNAEIEGEIKQILADKQAIINKIDRSTSLDDVWYSISKKPILDNEGNVTAIVGITRDVSDVKRAEQRANAQYELLRTFINAVPDHMYYKNIQLNYLMVNQAFADYVGAESTDSAIGTTAREWFPSPASDQINALDEEVLRTGEPIIGVEVRDHLHDQDRWYALTKVPLRDSSGAITGIVGIARDITGLKQAEQRTAEQYKLLHTLVNTIPDHIFVTDRQGQHVLVNTSYAEHIGAESAEAVMNTAIDQWFSAEDTAIFVAEDRRIIETGEPIINLEQRDHLGDHSQWFMVTKVPVRDEQGEITQVVGIARDVTELKKAERYRAEQYELLHTLINSVPDQIFVMDRENRHLIVNQPFVEHLGVESAEEVIGTDLARWFPADAAALFERENTRIMDADDPLINLEVQDHLHDQSNWYSLTKVPLRDSSGEIKGIVGIARDITELKQAEQRMAAQYKLLDTLINTIPDHIFVTDINGRHVLVNRTYAQHISAESAEAVIGTDMTRWFPDGGAAFLEEDRRIIETGEPIINLEERDHLGDHSQWFMVTKVPVRDEQGEITAVVGIARDVTDLKSAETRLAEQYALLRGIMDAVPDHIYLKNLEMRYVLMNQAFADHIGAASPQAAIGTTVADWFPLAAAQEFDEIDRQLLEQGESLTDVEVQDHLGDHSRWFMVSKVPIRNPEGDLTGVVGIAREYTQRKHAEQQVIRQRNFLQALIDAIPDHIFVTDSDHQYLLVNRAYAAYHDVLVPTHMVGKYKEDWLPLEVANSFKAETEEIVRTGKPIIDLEMRGMLDPDNWYSVSKVPVYDEDGVIRSVIGISRDITQRKHAEVKLADQVRLLRTLIDALPDHIYVRNTSGEYLLVNASNARDLGAASVQAMVGTRYEDWFPDHLATIYLERDQQVIQTGEPLLNIEERHVNHDGKVTWKLVTKVPLKDPDGTVRGLVGVASDVTKSKEAARKLTEQYTLLRTIMDAVPDEIFVVDKDLNYIMVNQAQVDLVGAASKEAVIGTRAADWFDEDTVGQFGMTDREIMKAGQPRLQIEETLLAKGERRFYLTSKVPLKDEAGTITGMVGIAHDITERKQMQEALARNEARLRAILDHTDDAYALVDTDGLLQAWNEALDHFLHPFIERSLMQGVAIEEFIVPDRLESFRQQFPLALGGTDITGIEYNLGDRAFSTAYTPVRTAEGDVIGVSVRVRDITERKQYEDNLQASQARLRAILDNTDDAYVLVDTGGAIQAWNQTMHQLLHKFVGHEMLSSNHMEHFVPPEFLDSFKQYFARALQGEIIHDREYPLQDRFFSISLTPVRTSDGEVIGVSIRIRDITERKQYESTLRENEARLKALINNTEDVIWSMDWDKRLILFNENFQMMNKMLFGKQSQRGKTALENTDDPAFAAEWDGYYDRALAGETFRIEMDTALPDGSDFTAEISFAPIVEADGDISGVTVYSHDVTQSRRLQREIERTRNAYRTLIDNFPDGMVALYDHDLKYTVAGGKGLAAIGMSGDDFVGKRLRDLFPPEIADRDEPHLLSALAGEATDNEVPLDDMVFRVQTVPIFDEGGDVISGILMSQNITTQKNAEKERLAAALEREKVAIIAQFIQDASHEFRTALSRIHLSTHALRRLCTAEMNQAKKYIDRIDDQSDKTLVLIEDLLTAARVDSDMSYVTVGINDLIQQVIQEVGRGFDKEGIELQTDYSDGLSSLVANETYLMLAFKKLLDNALRYTESGGTVTVRTRYEGESLLVEIEDTGIGMSEATMARIFERFFRVDVAHTTSGFGLGLPIAERIVEAHGGSIEVMSEEGVGSTFTVRLPVVNRFGK